MGDIIDIAYQILEMNDIIQNQKKEIENLKHYQKLYNELLDSSRKHAEEMMGNTFKMLLVPNVIPALKENNPFK
jgi:hypothetical protein